MASCWLAVICLASLHLAAAFIGPIIHPRCRYFDTLTLRRQKTAASNTDAIGDEPRPDGLDVSLSRLGLTPSQIASVRDRLRRIGGPKGYLSSVDGRSGILRAERSLSWI